MLTQLLRLPEVVKLSGKPRSTLYVHIKNGTWPAGLKLGNAEARAWPRYEVEVMNTAIIAGKTVEELRELVRELTNRRVEVFGKSDEEIRQIVAQVVRKLGGAHE